VRSLCAVDWRSKARELLLEAGVTPSYHRVRILEYVLQSKSHPTVDEIYSVLGQDISTISKTTVYNTLKLLFEKGIVKLIYAESGEVRAEGDVSPHAHLRCRGCGGVFDVPSELDFSHVVSAAEGMGLRVEDVRVNLVGLCSSCAEKL